jgi:hypothetical protein
MSFPTFLDPADEVINNEDDQILNQVVDSYTEGARAQETDEEPVEIVPIRQQEAMEAIRLLQSYEEQSDDGDGEILRRLA